MSLSWSETDSHSRAIAGVGDVYIHNLFALHIQRNTDYGQGRANAKEIVTRFETLCLRSQLACIRYAISVGTYIKQMPRRAARYARCQTRNAYMLKDTVPVVLNALPMSI